MIVMTIPRLFLKNIKTCGYHDYTQNNEGASGSDAKKAWNEHYADITKDQGKIIDFSKQD